MDEQLIFNFKADISEVVMPTQLNNPFSVHISHIAKIAAKEFQDFITIESEKWDYDFLTQRGKMFGILVVQQEDHSYGYLGTTSGNSPSCLQFVPSVFDVSTDDYFINEGMTELTEISKQLKLTSKPLEINEIKTVRKQKSIALQQRLFENYHFLNLSGKTKNLIDIFKQSSHGYPPSAAGECAAPKLLHHAVKYNLKSIALAEFFWGNPITNAHKEHKAFYPSCKDRCRPILEYMLESTELYNNRSQL